MATISDAAPEGGGIPRLGVLMSVYLGDRYEYFEQAINSVFAQTRPADIIVLVVDGPVEKEIDLGLSLFEDEPYPIVQVLRLTKNQGLHAALQAGLELLTDCDYIARMDADDISREDRFQMQIDGLMTSGADFCYSSANEFSLSGSGRQNISCAVSRLPQMLCFRNPIVHPSVCIRVSALLSIGGYRSLRWFEDYDLFVRLIDNGFRAHSISDCLINFRCENELLARRGGASYLKAGIRARLIWILEGRLKPYAIALAMLPFAAFSLSPPRLRSILRGVLRKGD